MIGLIFSVDFDFLNIRNNNSFVRLVQSIGEYITPSSTIFSDEVIRINSFGERKIRELVVTPDYLHILIRGPNNDYKHKMYIRLIDIFCIEVSEHNNILININFNKDSPTELIEVFRRSKLLSYFKMKNKVINRKRKIEHRTKKSGIVTYDSNDQKYVRPEIQGLIENASKSGIVKMRLPSSANYLHYILVLCDVGFLVMNISDVRI